MTRRCDRKPADPKMLVHVPRQAGADVLELLKQTFGPHPHPLVATLVAALEDGIARHAGVVGKKPRSQFMPLLREPELMFATPTPAHAHRVKSAAHQWARYHGHQVATRSHPHGTAVTVYLVMRAGAP